MSHRKPLRNFTCRAEIDTELISLTLDDLKMMKDLFPTYLSELMRGSRTLLAKKGLREIMFIEQLMKFKKDDYALNNNQTGGDQYLVGTAYHTVKKSMFTLLIKKLQ
jgi:hypothetical protein